MAMVADSLDTVKTLYQRFKDHDVEIVRTVDHGITRSGYFKDPDGNELEIYCEVSEPRHFQPEHLPPVGCPV